MKLIIDLPEKVVTAIQNGADYRYDIHTAIAQGIPYEETPQGDLISREALKKGCSEIVRGSNNSDFIPCPSWNNAMELIDNAPTVDISKEVWNQSNALLEKRLTYLERPQGGWIPIKTRELTEKEKEEYPDCTFMYDCKLPEDGEEVLVTTWCGNVALDTFCRDDGCYFEYGCDEGDVIAWRPLPKPYEKGGAE